MSKGHRGTREVPTRSPLLFLSSIKTSAYIQGPLMEGIKQYIFAITHNDPITGNDKPIQTEHPYRYQHKVRWEMTMAGLFHNEWANTQDEDPVTAKNWQIKVSTWMAVNCHKTWIL
jgi:hypothetical protein